MAINILNRGAATGATSTTVFTFSPTTSWTGGNSEGTNSAILAFSYDPAGVAGSDTFTSISDSHGNTWTLLEVSTNILGAGSGVIMRIYYSPMNVATLTTASVITLNFSSAVTAKAWNILEVYTDVSGRKILIPDSTNATGASATPSITSNLITVDNAIIGFLGAEGSATVTRDTDTTNGSWSLALADVKSGAGLTSVQIFSQYKIQTTADSTQTFNVTLSVSENYCIAYLGITEDLPQIDPFGTNGYYGI